MKSLWPVDRATLGATTTQWTGLLNANAGALITIAHGLKAKPKLVIAQCTDGGTFVTGFSLECTMNYTATTFDIFVRNLTGTNQNPQPFRVNWVAIF